MINRYLCLQPFPGLTQEMIESKLQEALIFRTMDHYRKSARRVIHIIAKNFSHHLDLYNFDEDGNLWVHIAIAEIVCKTLCGKNLVEDKIEPTLLELEQQVKKANVKLKIFDHNEYLQLIVRSYVLYDLTHMALEARKRRRVWIDKVRQSPPQDPRRDRLESVEDEYYVLNLLVNILGIEHFLTGIDPFELDDD